MPVATSLLSRYAPHPRQTIVLIGLIGGLAVGGLLIGTALLTRPEARTVALYACVRETNVLWVGTSAPARCPRGSDLIRDNEVEIGDPERSIGHRLTIALRNWLSIPGVMAALVMASLLWIVAGWRQGGTLRVRWLLVPPLAFVAAVCVAGPGHWFPKKPYEGPSVIPLGTRDAITALDLVGLALAALTIALAAQLVSPRRGDDAH